MHSATATCQASFSPLRSATRRHLEMLSAGDDPRAPLFPGPFKIATGSRDMSALSQQFHDLLVAAGLALPRGLALRQSTPLAADLAVLSFATVHAAEEKSNLPSAAWSNLEPVVPSISFFKNWDRCERMRRALIYSFARNQWPLDRFFPH